MFDTKLATFLTLANIKNYTKAAEILNLTQPAVSQHIKSLEEYYGVNLLRKHGREINLTEEGKILYKYAKEVEILYRSLEIELKNTSTLHKTYNIGATMTIGGYVLPYFLAEYKNIYKNIDILLQVNNTEEIIEKLLNRKIELALVEGPFDKNKFTYKKYKDDELVLAVSPKHPFNKLNEVLLEDVLEGNLILREKGSGTRKIIENKLVELGFNLDTINVYMEIGSINAIKSLVEANLGYSIISKEAIKKEVEFGLINVIPIKNIHIIREFTFIYLDNCDKEFIDNFTKFVISMG